MSEGELNLDLDHEVENEETVKDCTTDFLHKEENIGQNVSSRDVNESSNEAPSPEEIVNPKHDLFANVPDKTGRYCIKTKLRLKHVNVENRSLLPNQDDNCVIIAKERENVVAIVSPLKDCEQEEIEVVETDTGFKLTCYSNTLTTENNSPLIIENLQGSSTLHEDYIENNSQIECIGLPENVKTIPDATSKSSSLEGAGKFIDHAVEPAVLLKTSQLIEGDSLTTSIEKSICADVESKNTSNLIEDAEAIEMNIASVNRVLFSPKKEPITQLENSDESLNSSPLQIETSLVPSNDCDSCKLKLESSSSSSNVSVTNSSKEVKSEGEGHESSAAFVKKRLLSDDLMKNGNVKANSSIYVERTPPISPKISNAKRKTTDLNFDSKSGDSPIICLTKTRDDNNKNYIRKALPPDIHKSKCASSEDDKENISHKAHNIKDANVYDLSESDTPSSSRKRRKHFDQYSSDDDEFTDSNDELQKGHDPKAKKEAEDFLNKCKNSKEDVYERTYSNHEDKAIIYYIYLKRNKRLLKGCQFWQDLASRNIIQKRTWQSLRERYLKRIHPNLSTYENEGINKTIIESIQDRYGDLYPIHRKKTKYRRAYSYSEDLTILRFLADQKRYAETGGNKVWMDMISQCPKLKRRKRSWQSLKERFRKRLAGAHRNYELSKKHKKKFTKYFGESSKALPSQPPSIRHVLNYTTDE